MARSFLRFRSIAALLVLAALAVSASSQGTTGGLLYASDFANWSLPQGNTPMQGTVFYPNPDMCKVTSNGYTFLAAKVGRPLTIVDGANTETFTPTAVSITTGACMISGTMVYSHSSYSIKSGTAGAQEAIDYQASQAQGSQVVLTPAWTGAGGSTGIITGMLKGNNGITILDQRTAQFVPYIWNGSIFVAQPLSGGNITPSPQFSMFYQPNNGSVSAAQGDPNVTTDGNGNLRASTAAAAITVAGITNGQIHPEVCAGLWITAPAWCAGATTIDQMITAACAQLPSWGGTIDLTGFAPLGLQIWANSLGTACTSREHVTYIVDNAWQVKVTETDGGIAWPVANSGAVVGNNLTGECHSTIAVPRGIYLDGHANVTSIIGPAHLDFTQENFGVVGMCINGTATVSGGTPTVAKGLVYVGYIGGANTTIALNVLSQCNTSCIWMENDGGMFSVWGNWINVTSGNYLVNGSGIVVYATNADGRGVGIRISGVKIADQNIEHANGAGNYDVKIFNNGDSTWASNIWMEDLYTERNTLGTPATDSFYIADCWDCSLTHVQGGGGTGGTDYIRVSQSTTGRVRNIHMTDVNQGSSAQTTYANTLNDTTPGGSVLLGATAPSLSDYIVQPVYIQQNLPANTAYVAQGPDILAGAGLFSGTGTTYTGWAGSFTGFTAGQLTYALNNTDAPNAPSIPSGTSSQDIVIGANSTTGGVGVQSPTSWPMIAGQTYIVSFQAKLVSGSINLATIFVGAAGLNNCVQVQPYFPITSSWATKSFSCTAVATENVTLNVQGVSLISGSTGDIRLGNIQMFNFLSGTAGQLSAWTSSNTLGNATTAQQTVTVNGAACQLGGSCTTSIPLLMGWGLGVGATSGTTYYCTPASASADGKCDGGSYGPIPVPTALTVASCTVSEACTTGTCAAFSLVRFHGGGTTFTPICTPTAAAGFVSCTGTPNVSLPAGDGYAISVTPGQASSTENYQRVSCLVHQ